MRYLCFVKMDEAVANPPAALMGAMGQHVGEGFASGGWAIIEVDSEERARAEGQTMADLHLEHWPTWEGAVELRRISEPDEAPAGD